MMRPLLAAFLLFGAPAAFAQPAANLGDLTQAKTIELKDASGKVLLSGQFDHRAEKDGDIDKDATLRGGDARGEANIDISSDGEQELEIEVRGLPANQTLSVWIDARRVVSLSSDAKGRADAEWKGRTATR